MLIFWALCASLLAALALASGSGRCSAQHPSPVLDSLVCYNDYSSHIHCSWREGNRTHSQAPLSLFHLDEDDNSESECEPRGPPVPQPDGQLEAHCQYNTSLFAIGIEDHFFFKTPPHSLGLSRTLSVSQIVRVRPPHSLSQRAMKGGGRALHWKSSYPPSSPLYPTLNYQVKYRQTGQDWTVLEVSQEELVIESDSLAPGCWYEAGVRSRAGKGLWSDWSPLVEWTEDVSVPGPYNLQCEYDGETTMSCSWELRADLAQFVTYHLSYRTDPNATAQWCCSDAPLSVDPAPSVLRLSCTFSVSQPEQLLVELTPSNNTKMIRACKHIRQNPPNNVRLQEKEDDWVLSWTYTHSDRFTSSFEVRYWRTDTPEAFNRSDSQSFHSHRFHKSNLLPSTGYSATVRALVVQTDSYEGPPSDWAEFVHWDTHPAPWSYAALFLGVSGAVLCLFLTLLTFPACRRRLKVWEMSVPSPFKSKVLKEVTKVMRPPVTGKTSVRKYKNKILAYQKVVEEAHLSKIEVLEVQAIECSSHASEDPIQRLWLITTEEDGPYQRVSGQGTSAPANASLSSPGISPSPGSEPLSEGAMSGSSVQDIVSHFSSSTAPKTTLQSGTEYVELPSTKIGAPQDVSPSWYVGELELRDVCFHNGSPLLVPTESEIELPSAPKQLALYPYVFLPTPFKTQEVMIRQNPDYFLLPDLGTVERDAIPVPPAGSGSGDLIGD